MLYLKEYLKVTESRGQVASSVSEEAHVQEDNSPAAPHTGNFSSRCLQSLTELIYEEEEAQHYMLLFKFSSNCQNLHWHPEKSEYASVLFYTGWDH